MTRFSFVHASDLHLDSPFRGVSASDPTIGRQLHEATFGAFDRLVELCLERRVDFLLVAGDIYDGADRSLRAQLRFRDGVARLARHGIRVFAAHGNHDPLDGWSSAIRWPDGVSIFGADVQTVTVERNGETIATVSGISYPRRQEERNLARLFPGRAPHTDAGGPFRIGLLHTNCGGHPDHDPYAPCELGDLVERAIDYWALGHVHTARVLNEAPYVIYPGNSQGRHVREPGARGCMWVEVDGQRVTTEFVATDVVRWSPVEVDIGAADTLDALDTALHQALERAIADADGRALVCRVRLVGRGPLYRDLRQTDHVAQLRERLRTAFATRPRWAWVEAIDLDCQPEIDVAARRRGQDLGAEVLRAGDAWRDEQLRSHLWPAIEPLFGNPRLRNVLEEPSPDELRQLLTEAELLCLDRLDDAE